MEEKKTRQEEVTLNSYHDLWTACFVIFLFDCASLKWTTHCLLSFFLESFKKMRLTYGYYTK